MPDQCCINSLDNHKQWWLIKYRRNGMSSLGRYRKLYLTKLDIRAIMKLYRERNSFYLDGVARLLKFGTIHFLIF